MKLEEGMWGVGYKVWVGEGGAGIIRIGLALMYSLYLRPSST